MGDLTTDFSRSDFACKDGTAVPAALGANAARLACNLQALRDRIGACLFINSGYRTPAHNRAVGGVDGSQHVQALAADVYADGWTPAALAAAIEALIAEGRMEEGGLGVYTAFVHYDARGRRARWSGVPAAAGA